MKAKANNNIAVVCDDLTEFFVIQGAIDRLTKLKIPVDIIIPYDSGYNGLAEHTLKAIQKAGYSPKNDAPKNKQYKILLTPYPGLKVVRRIKHIYHLQFPYGALSSKPVPTYLPDTRLDYDGIISFNLYDQDFLGAYGAKVYPIPYWRYHNFKKEPKTTKKPVLLILPTFGEDTSCIGDLTTEVINDIKKHFYVITKAHHAIHFGVDGAEALEKLKSLADEFYDSDTAIDDLLKKADIVMSDNSGSIFEAICAKIPITLFAKDINSRRLKTIDTLQYQLVQEGFIPHAKKPEEILPMLLSIKSYSKKQLSLYNRLFLEQTPDPYQDFIKIINHYLSLDETKDCRKVLHDIMVKEWYGNREIIKRQEKEINDYRQHILAFENSTSWKITKPIRKIKKWKNH